MGDGMESGRGLSRRTFLQRSGRGLAGLAAVGPASIMLAACGGGSTAKSGGTALKPKQGGHLIYGMNDITGLNPMITHDTTSETMARLLFDPLIQVDNNQMPVPILASMPPTVSSDGLTYTFKLRSGVKWSDGTPVTSDDALWTWQLIFQPQYAAIAYEYRGQAVETIDSVGAPDGATFQVKTKHVYAPFLITFGTLPILPKHVLASVPVAQFNTMPFNSAPTVTNGQFKFVSWDKGSALTLARNESYYRGAPHLAGLVNKVVVGDPSQSLKTGEIDVSDLLNPADISQFSGTTVKVQTSREDEMLYMRPNLDPKKAGYQLFGDVRVRQALMWALDRPAIVKGIFLDNTAVVADSIWAGGWAYDPNVKPKYTHDVKKAGALLDAAGWKKSSGGVRAKDGLQMKFACVVNSGQQSWVQMVEAIQQQWSAIGVQMTLQSVQDSTWITQLEDTREFDMIIDEKAFGLYDPDPSQLLSSAAAQVGGENAGDYRSPEVDSLLQKALQTVDRTERKQAYAQLADLVMEQLPMLPVVAINNIWGVNTRVHGMNLGPTTQFQNAYWMKDVWLDGGQ
ncbi:MAG: peptide ABC transporter substrate-binding protein [Candidatus Dormiibacterota bacterium]